MDVKGLVGSGLVPRWWNVLSRHKVVSHKGLWRYSIAVLLLFACWPTVRWYGKRMMDGSDEPWGVLALGAALLFAVLGRKRAMPSWRYLLAAACLLVPVFSAMVMTPLIQALFVALALAALLADGRVWLGHTGLFVLALPLISSLQFYGGFPLRWVIGKLSAAVLSTLGWAVEAQGTVMLWRGEMIVIDAPCSGVQMLWSSAFLACLMICMQKPGLRGAVLLLQVASLTAFLGNVVRNVLLFFLESGIVAMGDWAHDGAGLGVFAIVLTTIVGVGSRFKKGMFVEVPQREESGFRRWGHPAFLLSLIGVLAVGTIETASALPEGKIVRTDIADTMRDRLLQEGWLKLPLDARSADYAKGFPGRVELFARDDRRLVVRVIDRATRRYHLSADCYRAIGYATKPMPIYRGIDGSMWGRVLATRGTEQVELRERVVSMDGQSWTDPSSWFWSAMMGRSEGPWIGYAETVPAR